MSIFNHISTSIEPETIHDFMAGSDITNMFWGQNSFNDFTSMLPLTVISILTGVIIAFLFGFFLLHKTSIASTKNDDKFLQRSFVVVWIYGFIVYDIGMCTGEYISLFTNAPMAILYAFKIFLLDSDVSEIHTVFHESWLYSFNFALVHCLAAYISASFVIKHFGFNILAKWRMRQECKQSQIVEESYVFWGVNDASMELIKSITTHHEESQNKSYRIILVRLNDDDDNPETRTGIARIFDFLSMPTSELEKLEKLKCLTTGTYSKISIINAGKEKDDDDVIGTSLKLGTLKRILEEKTNRKIHMLFLGDNEKENLHAVSLLLKDRTLKKFAEDPVSADRNSEVGSRSDREVVFYCHARYNSIHRVIEDKYMSGNLRVKVIDSSHISVENLKLDENLLPVKFVKVEDDATVSTPFNALVVGFSEVGQDSVRFIYEYGAFVKSGSTDTNVKRSEFHMHVVDKRMADVAGAFVANAPAIKLSIPFINGMENPDALITLHQMDCQSIEFYKSIESWIKTLNYIVIATDDDELNLTLAIRIFKMAVRYRRNMNNLCILTRVHDDEDGHIHEIAEYYNRLWKAQETVADYNGKIATQHGVKKDDVVSMPIHLFGMDKKTYTYHNIIDDSMEQEAVEFKERYTASTTKDYVKPACNKDYAWHTAIRNNIQCIDNDCQNNPTLSAMMGIRRMQGQDFANCFHATTKKIIAQEALAAAGLPEFKWDLLSRKSETVIYRVGEGIVVAPQIYRILNVLAQTEHLRWNASHEILGYVNEGVLPSRNEVRMHHSCITDWQNLTPKIQSYDFDVIDVTLNIINPDRPIENQSANENN